MGNGVVDAGYPWINEPGDVENPSAGVPIGDGDGFSAARE